MPIANVAQYRKSVGTYNNKPRPLSEKSIRKAIRKARRSHESISTRSNSCNTSSSGSSAVRTLLMVGLAASVIAPSAAILNGQLKESRASARATFPYLGLSERYFCSSVRLNNRQILTAKHCVEGESPWSWTDNWGGNKRNIPHRLDYPDGKVDLSILTYDSDLHKKAHCIPIMSKETQKALRNSPKDVCGLNGRIIVLGNGESENTGCLYSAVFDFHKYFYSSVVGVKIHDKPVQTDSGDSGAALMACNPVTKGYELMGINSAGGRDQDGKYSFFVDIAGSDEISEWINNNTKLYSCSSEVIKGKELYDTNYNYQETHRLNNCKVPPSHIDFVTTPLFSIVGSVAGVACLGLAAIYFCKKKELNFQAVPVQPSVDENDNDIELEEVVS